MKELSIKEKAKAYDLAIDRAKKWYNAPNIDKMPTYGNRIIEEIFPELKESEDEKWIPKEIAKYLKEKGDYRSCWIAWLEKQNPIMAKSPQLGEQKQEENKRNLGGISSNWSEEDERVLKATINTVLISRNSCEEDDEIKDRYDDELRWLKSLKSRVVRKEDLIERACEWLRTHSEYEYLELIMPYNYCGAGNLNKRKMIEDFKKYMKG